MKLFCFFKNLIFLTIFSKLKMGNCLNNGEGFIPTAELINDGETVNSYEITGPVQLQTGLFLVRGNNYENDHVKVLSESSLFMHVMTKHTYGHMNLYNHNYIKELLSQDNIVFAIKIICPKRLTIAVVFAGKKDLLDVAHQHFFSKNCSSEYRNNSLKIIPKIVEGNMIIKMAVKDQPVLIGNKCSITYFQKDNYLEANIDTLSSSVSRNTIGLVLEHANKLTVELGFLLQRENNEQILGSCNFRNYNIN